jgi:hypothetical protein
VYLGLNEFALHGQLAEHDVPALLQALLQFRKTAADHAAPLRCRREVLQRPVCGDVTLRDVLFELSAQDNRRRLLLRWLTTEGPFLDEERSHGADVWFECHGEVVTDWTLAELAHRRVEDSEAPVAAVSVRPSLMEVDPLTVTLVGDSGSRLDVAVRNHVDDAALREWLASCEPPMSSWSDLRTRARAACTSLVFSDEAFAPLDSQPFHPGVADRLLERLRVLEALKCAFAPDGSLTQAGQELRQKHFVGEKAWFTDSSTGEKRDFSQDLTFAHPERVGETLFCPWHGKVKTPQMRIHFSDPIAADAPLYVVYVGPKITKR